MPFFPFGSAMKAQTQNLHWLITRAANFGLRASHHWLGLRKVHIGQPSIKATEISVYPPNGQPCVRTPAFGSDWEKVSSPSNLCQELLRGYRPDIRKNSIGQEAKATLSFEPRQRICYYPGKVHGGYQAFLMDQLFADCCQPALTANLTMEFMRPIQPDSELVLSVWPVKIEGRKIYMEGSIQITDQLSGKKVLAARATALFILPRSEQSGK